eukprot:GDKJ01019943.1.p1 GENE.GDKJ01019943.1~~GDKJ01019943.1.p1  ORF type:complete len:527 (-),score=181.61 GDKJ01019943.1:127-1707(-)
MAPKAKVSSNVPQPSLFNFFNKAGEKKTHIESSKVEPAADSSMIDVERISGDVASSSHPTIACHSTSTNTKNIFEGEAYTDVSQLKSRWVSSSKSISAKHFDQIKNRKVSDEKKIIPVSEIDFSNLLRASVFNPCSVTERLQYGSKPSVRAVSIIIEDRSRPPIQALVTRRACESASKFFQEPSNAPLAPAAVSVSSFESSGDSAANNETRGDASWNVFRCPDKRFAWSNIDIDVDSDDEWEELFAADDISDNEKDEDGEEEEEEEAEEEGEFFVPDGTFQAEEQVEDANMMNLDAGDVAAGGSTQQQQQQQQVNPIAIGPEDFAKMPDFSSSFFFLPPFSEGGYQAPFAPCQVGLSEEELQKGVASANASTGGGGIGGWINLRCQVLQLGHIDACCHALKEGKKHVMSEEERRERDRKKEEERRKREEEKERKNKEKEKEKEELRLKKEEERKKKEEEMKRQKELKNAETAELKAAKLRLEEERQRDRDMREIENVPLARLFKMRRGRRSSVNGTNENIEHNEEA